MAFLYFDELWFSGKIFEGDWLVIFLLNLLILRFNLELLKTNSTTLIISKTKKIAKKVVIYRFCLTL